MIVHTIVCEKDSKGWQVETEESVRIPDLTCSTCKADGVLRETYYATPIPYDGP